MDPDYNKFGRGPRELTGAVDLISHYKLLPHYEFFCKRSLPISISDTHYLHNVVGDTEIRKGEGMQLGQLIEDTSLSRETKTRIQPFDLDVLREAFLLRDTAPVDLPSSEKGTPTIAGKSKKELKDKEKKHKDKDKDKDKEKDKEHKKNKHRHKDRSKDKEKEKKKEKSGHHDSGNDHSKRHHEKKRKHDRDEDNDIHKHKKTKVTRGQLDWFDHFLLDFCVFLNTVLKLSHSSHGLPFASWYLGILQHRSSRIDEIGALKVAG